MILLIITIGTLNKKVKNSLPFFYAQALMEDASRLNQNINNGKIQLGHRKGGGTKIKEGKK